MRRLLNTIFILILTLAPVLSKADALRGFIQKSKGLRYLEMQSTDGKAAWVLISNAAPQLQASLNKLKSGDYLVARGALAADGRSVAIESIESLGLQALVGTWMTSRLEIFEFKDFSRLDLYVHSKNEARAVKAGEFNYAVTPDQGSSYSIFLSGNQSVTLGSIEFKKSRLMLKLLDAQTGEVSSELSLSPLPPTRALK